MGRKKGGKNRVTQQPTENGAVSSASNPIQNPSILEGNSVDHETIKQPEIVPQPLEVDSTILDQVHKLVEEHNQSTNEPEQPARKKYQRKTKVVDDKETKLTEIEKGIEPLTGMLLKGINNLYPQPKEVSEEEIKAVNNGLALVMTKYMESFDKYVPEMMLLGSIALFSLPRLKKPERVRFHSSVMEIPKQEDAEIPVM